MSTNVTTLPNQTDYRWSSACQINFLTCLSETGSIAQAAEAAGKSRRAAYNLKFRSDGAAFRIGWDAAILMARATLADTLMERALCGQEDVSVRDPDTNTVTRHRVDNRLGMSLLTRLDRMAEAPQGPHASNTETAIARLVSQDFEAFLALIERGGAGAEAALFIAARAPNTGEDFDSHEQCELGADDAPEMREKDPDALEEEDERYALAYYDDISEIWLTSFPPPPGFDGEESECYGHSDYERTLSPAEAAVAIARADAKKARITAIAAAERDAYFGFSPEAV
jgi:hypothetical protein